MTREIVSRTRPKSKAKHRQSMPAAVEIRIGPRIHKYQPAALSDQATFGQKINELFASAASEPSVEIPDLLALTDEERFQLFTSLQAAARPFKLACGGKSAPLRTNPLDGVLDALEGPGDATRCERGRRAAIEAAALFCADHVLVASQRIADRLRKVGVKGALPQTIKKDIQSIIGASKPPETVTAMAEEFLAHRALAQAISSVPADESPRMVYYNNAFWVHDGPAWRRCQVGEMAILVTKYLQKRPGAREVTTRLINDVVANLQGLTYLPTSQCSLPLWLGDDPAHVPGRSPYLAFNNGLINLERALTHGEAPELLFHTPRHFSPVYLSFDFDPQARCPLWRQTLREIFPPVPRGRGQTPDRRLHALQEFMGYTLIPGLAYQKCLVLVGRGGNGKLVVTESWANLLGRDNVSHVSMDQFGERFAKSEMDGKLANIAAEMNRLDKVDEGKFKALVTGDPLQSERKFEPPFVMRPTAKLIFTTNELPPFRDPSNGIWRRLLIMPLFEQFNGNRCDRDRAKRLRPELPGIFNWALAGARRLQQQGAFSDCGVCAAALADHRFDSDVVAQYVAESVLSLDGSLAEIPCDVFYQGFDWWCTRNGRVPPSSTEFGKRLPDVIERCRESVVNPITGTRRWMYRRVRRSSTGAAAPHVAAS